MLEDQQLEDYLCQDGVGRGGQRAAVEGFNKNLNDLYQ